ncbi:YceI family protein [Xanthomonas campestris]|uniref:YceI family protein n=1 Tax=Xanthomonas campestris TaxID=339 RepID=UPI00096EB5DF|nr:YceI family protein [Xanthomonas campestris]MCF8825700.1 polyisoprenoid-binding protein [Xanthomonas campestris pv. raphani]MEA9838404.1 YceI family protein [Xanthomonas campestris pv. raphani]MEA9877949.1 YceI family protein [Xanthomonas campestris pv. raphani]MEA9891138.1 YceI family protein [Xanthomonas campestris pv. raphani]MEA9932078.1 YceI family protein [Xanthomonas campestris pv. raphani]
MTPLARLLAFPALVLTSLAATAAPVRYALDPVHTRVLFAVEHAGFSKALGTVSGSSGTLVFDPDDWAAATLEVTVPLRRADLGDAKWNEATLARNLLDAERFPDAHFVSTKVEASDATHAKVTGNLTLHGVTRPVTLDVTLNALKRHPLPPFRRTAGFSATATLSRAAFGVDAWKSMIGDTVELRIEAEAVREGRADSDDDAGKTTDPAAPEQPAPATTDPESGR